MNPSDPYTGPLPYTGWTADEPGLQDASVNDFLAPYLMLGGAKGIAAIPSDLKAAYGTLKGLGESGGVLIGKTAEGIAGAKAINAGLSASEGVTAFIKGFQKGANGEQIPIYGVKGPADKLLDLFGDANPGSVPESVLIQKGLLEGAAQKGISTDIAAQKALNATEDTGGSTFNLTKGELAGTPHYAVAAYPERELILKGEPTTKQIEAFIEKNQDLLNDPSNSLGVWKDTESGKTYLDVTKTISDKAEAMKLGVEKGQKAIFNLKDMSEIRLPSMPESQNPTAPFAQDLRELWGNTALEQSGTPLTVRAPYVMPENIRLGGK
jgi:hypothetical protein